MGNVNLNYVQSSRVKGRMYHYYRRNGRRQRIQGELGTRDFMLNYYRIHEAFEAGSTPGALEGSVGWLVEKYLTSADFEEKAPTTKRDYRRYLEMIKVKFGDFLWKELTYQNVSKLRDANRKNARKANYLVTMMKILGDVAREHGIRDDNPAKGIKLVSRGKTEGFPIWREDELNFFKENVQNSQVEIAFYLGLYTGQRPGDVLRMKWENIEGDYLEIVQGKTKRHISIRILPVLAEKLKGVSRNSSYIVSNLKGEPYTDDGFRTIWNKELTRMSMPKRSEGRYGVSMHGLRKNATVALMNAGCTLEEVKSWTGHTTDQMAEFYGSGGSKKAISDRVFDKLVSNETVKP